MLQNVNTNFVRRICDQTREIERLRADNACLSKAVIDTQEERDLAQAEFRTYHKAWEEQAARIKELEDALAEYQRLGKTIAGKVPCLALHGDCGRCSAKMRGVCGALEQIAGGKIGPDADECSDDLPSISSPYRSWQITDERREALKQAAHICHEVTAFDIAKVFQAMLEEASQ